VKSLIRLGILCLLVVTPALADSFPEPFIAQYEAYKDGNLVGSTEMQLTKHDNQYQYRSKTETAGAISWLIDDTVEEYSLFSVIDGAIRVEEYRYRRTGMKDRSAKLIFDWQKGEVANQIGNKPWRMEIPKGTLDKHIVRLALAHKLSDGSKTIAFKIADGGRLKTYRYTVVGEETLHTKLGDIKTLKVERRKGNNKKSSYTLWCAEQFDYLPVRIQKKNEKGESLIVDMVSLKNGQ